MGEPAIGRPVENLLRAANRLGRADWRDLMAAAVWLPLVRVGLRTVGFDRVCDLVRTHGGLSSDPKGADPWSEIHRLRRLVAVASRFVPWGGQCLERSLVLQRLLARRHIHCELRIGVHRRCESLDAHAWLEFHGEAVGETDDSLARFTPLTH